MEEGWRGERVQTGVEVVFGQWGIQARRGKEVLSCLVGKPSLNV